MAIKGGYHIINLARVIWADEGTETDNGVSFQGTPLAGLYDAIETALGYGKACMSSGLTFKDITAPDTWTNPVSDAAGTKFTFNVSVPAGYTAPEGKTAQRAAVTVDSDNNVSLLVFFEGE